MVNKLLIILFSCTLSSTLWSQETNLYSIKAENIADDELINVELPPLDELFESARSNPAVEIFKIRQEQEASSFKTEKRSWLKYFRITAGYQYGSVGVNSSMSTPDIAPIYTSSGSKQSWYNFGAGVSIPLDDLFDRVNRIKRQKLLMKQTEMEIEKLHDEQKLSIIQAYSDVQQNLVVLKTAAESVIFANAQYKSAENDFINGRVTLGDLSKDKSAQATAIATYEKSRAQLNSALLRLEVLSKTKILNK